MVSLGESTGYSLVTSLCLYSESVNSYDLIYMNILKCKLKNSQQQLV